MIKHTVIFGISLLAIVLVAPARATPVEYVRICTLYGHGWYYLPGTEECFNPTTGVIKANTDAGTISTNSALAARVAFLEAQIRRLYQQFGLQFPEENGHKDTQ